MRELARERIQMYDLRVQEAVEALLDRYPEAELDESLWPAIKLAYIGLLHDHSSRSAPKPSTTPWPARCSPAALSQRVHLLAPCGRTEHWKAKRRLPLYYPLRTACARRCARS